MLRSLLHYRLLSSHLSNSQPPTQQLTNTICSAFKISTIRSAPTTARFLPMRSVASQFTADAVDLKKEASRLKAYANFKPVYCIDTLTFTHPSIPSDTYPKQQWRLLATASVDSFDLNDFKAVMDVWANDPTKIYPPVDKTQSISEESTNSGKTLTISRKLLPKRKDKDSELVENIIFQFSNSGLSVEFIPQVENETQSPFYYPKVKAFRYSFLTPGPDPDDHQESTPNLPNQTFDSKPCSQIQLHVLEYYENSAFANFKKSIWKTLFEKLFKWCVTQNIGFKKRANHDSLVPKPEYELIYSNLKLKYANCLINDWIEKTDPKKFVYEDLAIASWLIALWNQDSSSKKKPSFVDLGCGNGLLVYILAKEGYPGYGIDQSSRNIWSKFSDTAKLLANTINPDKLLVDADWIIGNHADELVPWIPIIAAKSGFKKFAVIPCCYHDLTGEKMTMNVKKGESKYGAYIQYVSSIIQQCGYNPERDFLRIPSTRNTVLVGRPSTIVTTLENSEKREFFLQAANDLSISVQEKIKLRVPDSIKSKNQCLKQEARKKQRHE